MIRRMLGQIAIAISAVLVLYTIYCGVLASCSSQADYMGGTYASD